MVYAAVDIHKALFQVAVLDPESGELTERRVEATREALLDWAVPLKDRLGAVALEATTGWRWVTRELLALGIEVRLVDPAQARALRGRTRRPKTDRLDARWLVLLLAKEMLPQAWLRAGGDPGASRQDSASAGARARSHPLGAAPARSGSA
jgi:transposase